MVNSLSLDTLDSLYFLESYILTLEISSKDLRGNEYTDENIMRT